MIGKTSSARPLARRRARVRLAGLIVLALGIASAGVVYWIGSRSADLRDDPSMSAYYKTQARDMRLMSGKTGEIMDDFSNDLQQPGTQAVLIVGFSAAITGGCFFVARRME